MSLEAFFAFLAARVASAAKWLRAYFSDEKGQTQDASPENIVKYSKIKTSGDVHITNINLNLVADPTAPEYSKVQLNEILRKVSEQISAHSGLAVGLEEGIVKGVENRSASPLTEIQKNYVKKFTEAGWGKDKISSIITAYRIINAEDANKFIEAKQIMESAFSGRKKVLDRKMYNLARSGYLGRFAFDLLFSAKYKTDEAISQTLNYFPDAIFLDQDFLEDDLNAELLRRQKEAVNRVSVYARGKRRIEVMEHGYSQYLKSRVDMNSDSSSNKKSLYMIERKMPYRIGDSDAETLELILTDIAVIDFKDSNFDMY